MKIFLSLLLVVILVLTLGIGVDESAMKLHDDAFERAMITFGLAKGLNAIISLIQGTELSITPIGIGLNFTIGEVLDPFNDMVERFSWVMLMATVSLGIQKILLVLSSKLFIQVGIVLSVGVSFLFIWKKELYHRAFFILPFKILLLLLVLRFGAITSVYASEYLYNSVLHTEYVESNKIITVTKDKLEQIEQKNKKLLNSEKDAAWYNLEINEKYNNLKSNLNISNRLDSIKNDIEKAWRNIITLITVFIIQTVVIPLLFLWLFLVSLKWLFKVKVKNATIMKLLQKG